MGEANGNGRTAALESTEELHAIAKELGLMLRLRREAAGLTQGMLERVLRASQGTVSHREKGEALLGVARWLKHLQALGCEVRVRRFGERHQGLGKEGAEVLTRGIVSP